MVTRIDDSARCRGEWTGNDRVNQNHYGRVRHNDAYSQKIIDNKPYKKKDQLLSKQVVPKTTYDKIKE